MLDETDPPELDLDTLTGDIRDALLTHFQSAQKPWPQMTQRAQRDTANAFERAAQRLVKCVVAKLSAHEFASCAVALGEVKIKGDKGIEAKIVALNTGFNRDALGAHVGSTAIIVMCDAETFYGERHAAKTDPDQPELIGLPAPDDGDDDAEDDDD